MKKIIVCIAVLATIEGCATQKLLQAIGGSRADGTVTLALQYGEFEIAHWNWNQGQQIAEQRCKAWGYSGAERFNDGIKSCIYRNQYGCTDYQVTVQYQCTGADRPQ